MSAQSDEEQFNGDGYINHEPKPGPWYESAPAFVISFGILIFLAMAVIGLFIFLLSL